MYTAPGIYGVPRGEEGDGGNEYDDGGEGDGDGSFTGIASTAMKAGGGVGGDFAGKRAGAGASGPTLGNFTTWKRIEYECHTIDLII